MNMRAARWELVPDAANDDLDKDLAHYKGLLESTLAIPWRIDWATKQFSYIGPQIEALLGWTRESWRSVDDWASRIHCEERDSVVDYCVKQSIAGIDHEADFRMLTKDGDYIWVRDIVHVVRGADGVVDSLIGFMIDITEQKRAEHELLETKNKLERLSFKDGLTGVSNRRFFDERLQQAWNRATVDQLPLGMILLDIDCFKQFNDFYGHVDGDECLIRVAQALNDVCRKSQDIVARYGGEEFAILLPHTDEDAALEIAERCRHAIEALQIRHEGSTCNAVVTVSVGVQVTVPTVGGKPRAFYQSVDASLYAAKQQGRNRVVSNR